MCGVGATRSFLQCMRGVLSAAIDMGPDLGKYSPGVRTAMQFPTQLGSLVAIHDRSTKPCRYLRRGEPIRDLGWRVCGPYRKRHSILVRRETDIQSRNGSLQWCLRPLHTGRLGGERNPLHCGDNRNNHQGAAQYTSWLYNSPSPPPRSQVPRL